MKQGLLLINLGTPDAPDTQAVRRYLSEFLADPRVIDLPAPVRYLLLYAFILPTRPALSAKAYKAIWTYEGSPLMVHSRALVEKLQEKLGPDHLVALGMRYGKPSIEDALDALSSCEKITILPLFPQFASSSTGSALEKALSLIAKKETLPSLKVIRDFYIYPGFLNAAAALIKPYLPDNEYILFSYHGIPERHVQKSGCKTPCQEVCPAITANNQACYKAQCHATTRALAELLQLEENTYSTAFQSRLGRTPWIKPYTDLALIELAKKGIKRIAVVCPAFVADCLETLEEIGIRAKEQWEQLGGERLSLIPCVNDSALWVDGIVELLN